MVRTKRLSWQGWRLSGSRVSTSPPRLSAAPLHRFFSKPPIPAAATFRCLCRLFILLIFFRERGDPLLASESLRRVPADDLQIINLSARTLRPEEVEVLRRGLSFVPTTDFSTFAWTKDLHLFCRRLKWHKFFKSSNRDTCRRLGLEETDFGDLQDLVDLNSEHNRTPGTGPFTKLRPKSNRMPPPLSSEHIDIFLQLVTRDLDQLGYVRPRSFNLSVSEMEALRSLERDETIVIKPSDKGGNLVILDSLLYKNMCLDLLKDREGYEILHNNPTVMYLGELKNILDMGLQNKVISTTKYTFLLPVKPLVATFYGLPKVHKGTSPLKGRPIVSGVN
ncbi:uncharacterized protein LOC122932281 isoform X1 [Bufo gargarizans]|uniref:uncharacterized protein LOC122932281 isoform X1 n=1 Tax=Bufo gargarizans TaxID=30331 RepID=UPI001CF4175D|nr:uncharacterized protein LOC122932281 isoform X1 [Bufo gargarizans]XP_044142547.1 uncharacterized protein LOC122932281 isoform X1 [Bufo gargarizans]